MAGSYAGLERAGPEAGGAAPRHGRTRASGVGQGPLGSAWAARLGHRHRRPPHASPPCAACSHVAEEHREAEPRASKLATPYSPDVGERPAVADVVRPPLVVLLCGVNPGLRSAELGQHFAHPANRFWKLLAAAGLTERVLSPAEQWELTELGLGITNLVAAPSRSASELSVAELRAGAAALERKVRRWRPEVVAFLGVQAYRSAFGATRATLGEQPQGFAGARAWVLPNPSGIQASYGFEEMAACFSRLGEAAGMKLAAGRQSRRSGRRGGGRP